MRNKVFIYIILLSLNAIKLMATTNNVTLISYPACEGSKNGRIQIIVDPNAIYWSPPFDYYYENLDNGDAGDGTMYGYVHTITGLASGLYKVKLYVSIECTEEGQIIVETLQNNLNIDFSVDNEETCNNASIQAQVSGGSGNYTYQWNNGSTNSSISNLHPGLYCLTVTDAGACSKTKCTFISGGHLIVEPTFVKNVSTCNYKTNSQDGVIEIVVEGGSGNYQFDWTHPYVWYDIKHTQNVDHLSPHTFPYHVKVTDNITGCIAERDFYICCCFDTNEFGHDPFDPYYCNAEDYGNIYVEGDVYPKTDPNSNNGYILLNVIGGDGGYVYSWAGPNGYKSSNKDIYNLAPGEYCVKVTDGCKIRNECYTIGECSQTTVSLSGQKTNACNNYNVGKIILTASGGTQPYKYKWSNGAQTKDIMNLSGGTYCVTVIDASGCRAEDCYQITSPNATRSGCKLYCNDDEVHDYGIVPVFRPSDCRYIDYYCGDGVYLRSEFVGLKEERFNPGNCSVDVLCFNNQPWTTIYGLHCRTCIHQLIDNFYPYLMVGCYIDYCYFQWPYNLSRITHIQEKVSVAYFEIQGICSGQIFDICGDDSPIFNFDYDCDEEPPIQDGDCGDFLSLDYYYEGHFGGDCTGLFKNNSIGNELTKSDSSFLKLISSNTQKIPFQSFDNVNKLKVESYIDSLSNCNKIFINYYSHNTESVNISILTLDNRNILNFTDQAISGFNTSIIENVQFNKISTDSLLIKIAFSKGYKIIQKIKNNCYIKNNANPIFVKPNPFYDCLEINNLKVKEIYSYQIINLAGQVVKSDYLNENRTICLENISQGIYLLKLSNNEINSMIKIVKSNKN